MMNSMTISGKVSDWRASFSKKQGVKSCEKLHTGDKTPFSNEKFEGFAQL